MVGYVRERCKSTKLHDQLLLHNLKPYIMYIMYLLNIQSRARAHHQILSLCTYQKLKHKENEIFCLWLENCTNFTVVVVLSLSTGHRPHNTHVPRSNNPVYTVGYFIVAANKSLCSNSNQIQNRQLLKQVHYQFKPQPK